MLCATNKEFYRISKRYSKLTRLLYKPEKVELERPIHYGYNLEYIVKKEYLKSKIINKLVLLTDNQHLAWCKHKSFETKYSESDYDRLIPEFKKYHENDYDKIDERIRSFYIIEFKRNFNGWYKRYIVDPDIIKKYFTTKRTKHYITHKYLDQPDIKSEKDELFQILTQRYYGEYYRNYRRSRYNKFMKKMMNKGIRNENKKIIKEELFFLMD